MLEAELRESSNNLNSSVEKTFFGQQTDPHTDCVKKQEIDVVSACYLFSCGGLIPIFSFF